MGLSELVAVNPVMREILERAERVAPYPTTVLITGETGVGKEVIAAFLHEKSPRSGGPFVKVNCGAIPDSLMESELFGYERGAFTGAKREGSPGLFEAADRGTLLLDEIGELTLAGQVKLLRALQEREVRRVGGTWSRALDVRVIATTNQDLEQRVKEGRFRSDLFYRLRVVHFHIPPLRERSEEIEPLVHHFSQVFSELYGIRKSWDEGALALLRQYPWPGNVRELRHLVESV
ncbi:MAG: sigma 54-interacting transcriptional regulator, partial [Alicyclobacillaceae bacterium]|nr:sigma 54-interacting transcriptional regulator [Alicyclobacillaceae bacterium]